MLDELGTLETKQLELQQQLAQVDIVPPVVPLSPDDIIANIQAALDRTSDEQRGIILRGFIKRIDSECFHKVITGRVIIQPNGLGEVIVPL
jgi:hypothetical protein